MKVRSTITTPPPAPETAPPPASSSDENASGSDPQPTTAETDEIERALEHSLRVYGDLGLLKFELDLEGNKDVCILSGPLLGVQGICFRRDNRAFIVFRGSNELQDWILNAIAVPIGIPFFIPFRHAGFAAAWQRVRGQLRNWLRQTGSTDEPLSITGHSLGGAVATLAALDLAREHNVRDVITFGAPRSLLLGATDIYSKRLANGGSDQRLGEQTWTVVNFRDIVSKIPTWPYREVGNLVFIDGAGSVHWGEAAQQRRSTQRYSDAEFVLSDWPNTEAVPTVPTVTAYQFGVPQSNGLKDLVDVLKAFAAPLKMLYPAYIFLGLLAYQLARSGLNHPLGLYGEIMLPDQYEKILSDNKLFKSGGQKFWETTTVVILGGLVIVAGYFLWRWLF